MTNYSERLDEVLSTVVDDNKLRPHRRVAPGTCSCGFDAYSVKGIMLDYGDILSAHINGCMEKVEAYEATVKKAKQAITSLNKELVAEALPEKPKHIEITEPIVGIDRLWQQGRDVGYASGQADAIDKFERNLFKALEEE